MVVAHGGWKESGERQGRTTSREGDDPEEEEEEEVELEVSSITFANFFCHFKPSTSL